MYISWHPATCGKMMVWSASGSLVINKMSGCPPRPVSPHHCPGHRGNTGTGDITVTNSSAARGILRLGEWEPGWEHVETLSASDIMTGSTKHHWYKDYKVRGSHPPVLVTQLLCKQQTLILRQNQNQTYIGPNKLYKCSDLWFSMLRPASPLTVW